MQDPLLKSYEDLPYKGDVHLSTHPGHLRVLAKLFGVPASETKKARILEIGCANGENLFSIAKELPQATLTGIEFSREHVQRAKKTIVAKALKNVEVQQLDILKVTPALGKFDYIIAHGIYSWVSREVREKIFTIFSDQLTDNGIAYLSYNVLPGWHLRGMLRDVMMLSCESQDDPKVRIEQARRSLALFANILPASALREAILPEIRTALAMPDWYLAHDYLETHNTAFTFGDICKSAKQHKLNYVADADLVKALPQQLPVASRQQIEGFQSDRLLREALYDYAHVRMFRRSLFCADKHPVLAIPQQSVIATCAVKSELSKDANDPALYRHPHGGAVSCAQGVLAQALGHLLANSNKPVFYKDLLKVALQGLPDPASASVELEASLMRLFFADLISLVVKED